MENYRPNSFFISVSIVPFFAYSKVSHRRMLFFSMCISSLNPRMYRKQIRYIISVGAQPYTCFAKIWFSRSTSSGYLRRRAADPARYTPPSGWYKNYPNHKPPENALVRRLELTGPRRKKLRSRLAKQLAKAPDVLTLQQICDITGYNRHTVSRWCTEGRLKPIMKTPTFRVPKVWLLDFLCSDDYNNICRKSRKHNQMVREMQ